MRCKRCGKQPNEITEYIDAAKECNMLPDAFVLHEEGTYNRETGLFWCTLCYVKIGMPLGKA